jgi:CelD/BcsL family acetyltransferase involved in cellulose biosynthesis
MRARLIRLGELSSRDVDAWRVLGTRAAEPNPFFEPEFVIPLSRHHALEMTLLVVDMGTEMVVCLPLYGHERPWRLLPLPVWTAPNALGIPLVEKDHGLAALPLAIEFLARRSGLRRLLLVDRVPCDGPVGAAFSAAVSDRRPPWEEPRPSTSPVVWRRPTASYLDDTLRGKRRQTMARKRRTLERELGSPVALVELQAGPDTAERFLAMEASGWKGRARTAMLCDPGRAAFFRDMCASFSAGGRLHFSSLEAGGTSVAMKCQVVSGRGLYNLKTAYDERFAQFSPGVLLEIEAVRLFHGGGYDFMDSCTNHPNSPQFWLYPDSRILTSVIVALGGRAGRMAISGLESAWRMGRWLVRKMATPRR